MNADRASLLKHKKSAHSQKYGGDAMIDDSIFDKLQDVISGIDLINEDASNNYQPVLSFFNSKFSTQVIQSWSYYAQVNNHQKFTSCTSKLAKALRVLDSDASTLACGSTLIRSILQENVKVLYRGLNNMKPSITNSTLRLMRQIVSFNHGQHVDDFLTYFTLSLPSLPRILAPTKAELADVSNVMKNPELSMRYNFIQFWLSFIENASPILRKAILTENSQIMSGWYKYMTKVDSVKLMIKCISTLKDFVLGEKSLKKATKCRILNESFISKIHHFYYSNDADLVRVVDQFFESYSTTEGTGVAFSDDKVWFSEPVYSSMGATSTGTGALVVVNNKKFYLYNKLLFTMLTFFKPWEDELQLNRVIKTLQTIPELVAPYSNFLNTLGSHEPRMTSYWFGMTLLLGRIINLPIPARMHDVVTNKFPAENVVMESIIPSPITKGAMTKSISDEVNLTKQMGCQLLVFSFKKLEEVLTLYDDKGWNSAKSKLINNFKARIPELSTISSALDYTSRTQRENKVLLSSISMILKYYSKFFSLTFSITLPTDNIYVEIIKSNSFTGLDLVMLDNFLQFQEFNGSQAKWYNAKSNENSIFTSLMKLASSINATNAIINKVTILLENLLKFSVVFRSDQLIASPVTALINSLQVIMRVEDRTESQENKIWKLLDESISRCMKTPYKYVDASASFGLCSPFLVALLEQWNFVEKNTPFDLALKWILIYLRTCCFIGEPVAAMKELVANAPSVPEQATLDYLDFDRYEDHLAKLRDDDHLINKNSAYSFFHHITLMPAADLSQVVRYPINELDIAGIMSRIQLLLFSDDCSISIEMFYDIVDNLLTRVAKYALSQGDFKSVLKKKISFQKVCVPEDVDITNKITCQKHAYVTNSMIEIGIQLEEDMQEFGAYIHLLWQKCLTNWSTNESLATILINGLRILSSLQLKEVLRDALNKDQTLLAGVLAEMCQRNISLKNEEFMILLQRNCVAYSGHLAELLRKELVESPQFDGIISVAIKDPIHNQVVEQVLKHAEGVQTIITHLKEINGDYLHIKVAAAITGIADNTEVSSFVEKALMIALDVIRNSRSFEYEAAVELCCKSLHSLDSNLQQEVIKFTTSNHDYRFSSLVAELIEEFSPVDDEHVDKWIQKSVLFITKNFAERSQLADKFYRFLDVFKHILFRRNIWSLGLRSALNSQIEVILGGKWISHVEPMTYLGALIMSGDGSKVDDKKMLQLLLNNENSCLKSRGADPYIRFLTVRVLYCLFRLNPDANSTPLVQEKLLLSYNGSTSPADRIILDMLRQIETKALSAWTNRIFVWDFQEGNEEQNECEDETPLITQEKEGLILTLKKSRITRTVEHFSMDLPELPVLDSNDSEGNWSVLESFGKSIEAVGSNIEWDSYDPMFLLLTIVNNDELLKTGKNALRDEPSGCHFDIKKLVDSGLFEVVVISLSQRGDARDIALTLLHKMLDSLDSGSTFKESYIYRVLLMKIAYTFQLQKNQEKEEASPLVWYMIARLTTILSQPSSFLYEKACRWVLYSPSVQPGYLPLYDSVVVTKPSEDGEHYYSYLQWFLEGILGGLKTKEDINLLKSRSLLEWMMNLLNSPYLNFRLQALLNTIIYQIERIETGGSTLITRYAGTSFLESLHEFSEVKLAKTESELLANTKNRFRLRQTLMLQQSQVNLSELQLGLMTVAKSQKRLTEWMEGDIENTAKRVCHARASSTEI